MVEATSSGYKTRNERKAQALRELMRKEVRSAKTAAAAAKADSKCLSPTKKIIRNYNLQSLARDLPGDALVITLCMQDNFPPNCRKLRCYFFHKSQAGTLNFNLGL